MLPERVVRTRMPALDQGGDVIGMERLGLLPHHQGAFR
jgi:hypothetical protein